MYHRFLSLLSLAVLFFYASLSHAKDEELKIEDLNWVNQSFLSNQRVLVDELTRRHLGSQIRGNKSDMATLQRLIDREVISRDDTPTLQALGVVLGDIYVSEHKTMEWKVLEDHLGRSHVVCIKNTQHCLFPITMLSRRIEVGLNPRVDKAYNVGLSKVAKHLPKLPFQD